MLTGGLQTDLNLYLWILMTMVASYFVLQLLKKQSKEALCPHCQADLFEVIEVAKSIKLDFNFCPKCAEKIEV